MGYTPSGFGSGGGVPGHIVKNPADAAMTQRTYLKFISAGAGTQVAVADGADYTQIAIPDQLTAAPDDVQPWEGALHSNWGSPEIIRTLTQMVVQTAGSIYGQYLFSTTLGRVMWFTQRKAITVRRIIYFACGASSNLLTGAIYNSAGALVWSDVMPTTAGAWTQITGLNFTLTKGAYYIFGLACKSGSTTAALLRTPTPTMDGCLATFSGTPTALSNYGICFANMAGLSSGVWPANVGAYSDASWASTGSPGTMPVVFFSSLA